MHLKALLFLIFLPTAISWGNLVDLEQNPPEFVLETQQIFIEDYPYAFNPSIISWKDHYLLSFRVLLNDPLFKQSLDTSPPYGSFIGVVELDRNFKQMAPAQILDLKLSPHPKAISRASDARLVQVGDRILMVYSDSTSPILHQHCRIHVAELVEEKGKIIAKEEICLSRFELESPAKQEKNWVPFAYQQELFMAYRLSPHRVFKPKLSTGECDLYCVTHHHPSWKWGELRGGTPAIALDNYYLAFFHSSLKMASVHSSGEQALHYFIGAYTFDLDPPFKIRQISAEPIIGPHFYHGENYPPYWKPVVAIFPCGILVQDSWIWVTYGRQDHELWVMKMDRQKLLNSLVPVSEKFPKF